jgi:hypothetical protein
MKLMQRKNPKQSPNSRTTNMCIRKIDTHPPPQLLKETPLYGSAHKANSEGEGGTQYLPPLPTDAPKAALMLTSLLGLWRPHSPLAALRKSHLPLQTAALEETKSAQGGGGAFPT